MELRDRYFNFGVKCTLHTTHELKNSNTSVNMNINLKIDMNLKFQI